MKKSVIIFLYFVSSYLLSAYASLEPLNLPTTILYDTKKNLVPPTKNPINSFLNTVFVNENNEPYCYALATAQITPSKTERMVIKININKPGNQWQYVPTPSQNPDSLQFLGLLGSKLALIITQRGIFKGVYSTVYISEPGKSLTWTTFADNDRAIIEQINGRSDEVWWERIANKETGKKALVEIQTPKGASVKATHTPYSTMALTPRKDVAWFIEPQTMDKKAQLQIIEDLDDPDFKKETTITAPLPSVIKNFVAVTDEEAFFTDDKNQLYLLSSEGLLQPQPEPTTKIATLGVFKGALIVAMQNKLYSYTPALPKPVVQHSTTLKTPTRRIEHKKAHLTIHEAKTLAMPTPPITEYSESQLITHKTKPLIAPKLTMESSETIVKTYPEPKKKIKLEVNTLDAQGQPIPTKPVTQPLSLFDTVKLIVAAGISNALMQLKQPKNTTPPMPALGKRIEKQETALTKPTYFAQLQNWLYGATQGFFGKKIEPKKNVEVRVLVPRTPPSSPKKRSAAPTAR